MIAEDFNTSFISMDRSSRHEIKKETVVLNNTLDHLNLTRQSIPKQQNIISAFLSSAHGTFSRIDHIIGHKS